MFLRTSRAMRRSSLAPEAARAGTPATSDSPHETLFTDSLDAFQSGSESSWAPHRKVQTELMLDDIRAALNETIEGVCCASSVIGELSSRR